MMKLLKSQSTTLSFFSDFWKYRDLLRLLVKKNIKVKYRRSFLGYIWSILNPLLVMIVMTLVFTSIFKRDIENYPVYLFTGQLLFSFMTGSTHAASTSMIESSAMLRKTCVPKQIFVIAKITGYAVEMLFSMGALFLVILVTGARFYWTMLLMPLVLVQLYIFATGLGLFLAQACVFFQDVSFIYRAFTTAWLYITPIFYPIESLPHMVAQVIRYGNPMYQYINQFRSFVYYGKIPDASSMIFGSILAILMLCFGIWSFRKTQHKFILYL